ncbi:LysR family transcriptional regulator [Pelagibacterium lacus]|uniref:LysR family transcriptional regulator n=1 Tax=Pelagibacterium lacus TaxID=2282655 RepID=A0A369W2X2_9HYPH|nr:LysR family transcriptional regulator [Pelagibacterium lacus]RDE08327.1 LysR family transcriptional regulator [Pelagibacterium lacus]
MNWDDIRIFLAVARTGQMLGAARQLRLNHATVARRVSALEAALGATLFTRRTNGCDLTSEGEALLTRAELMETAALGARADVGESDAALSGTVRIGAPDGFGVAFLAPRLGKLRRLYPQLRIQLVPVPRSFSLSKREADIAITTARPTEGRLVARKLVDYRLGLYASTLYVKQRGLPQSVADLRHHSLVGYVEDLIFTPSLDFAREIWKDWQADVEVSSAIGQSAAVRGGAGIGILHDFLARDVPELVAVLPDLSIARSYWTVVHEDMRAIRRVGAVADFIAQEVSAARQAFTPLRA